MKVALLTGGTGGAKLAAGLAGVLAPDELTIIANTADDDEFWGLLVSPDVDATLYRLAGVFNEQSGFGVAGDTFNALAMLRRLGEPDWFALGDFDIGLHLLRAQLLSGGLRLTEAVAEIGRRLAVQPAVVPMSDQPVRTRVATAEGELSLQEWFVARRCEPAVRGLRLEGIGAAHPAPEALRAVRDADAVIIGPSNPVLSIDPILALLGDHLQPDRVVVVSPIVDGRSLKGPTVQMLRDLGEEPTSAGVAARYARFARTFVVDVHDAALTERIAALGMRPEVRDTVMTGPEDERRLARELVGLVGAAMA